MRGKVSPVEPFLKRNQLISHGFAPPLYTLIFEQNSFHFQPSSRQQKHTPDQVPKITFQTYFYFFSATQTDERQRITHTLI